MVQEAVMALIAVHLEFRYIALLGNSDGTGVDRVGMLEVEAAHRRLAGRPLAQRTPVAERVLFDCATGAMKADAGRGPVDRVCGARVVADLQHVTVARMLVPIAVAGGFPAPAQVVVIGLVPLRGHRELRLLTGDLPVIVRQAAVAGKDLLRLLAHALPMEQAVVAAQARVRQPWPQDGFVERHAAIGLDQFERAHITGEWTQATVGLYERDAQQLAVDRFQFDPGVVAQEFHRVVEVARHVFGADEPVHHQRGLRAVVLRKRHAQQAGVLVGVQQCLQVSHRLAHRLSCGLLTSGCARGDLSALEPTTNF